MNPPLELLVNLVGIQSVSGQEMECSKYLAEVLTHHGWDKVHIDEVGNVIASRGSGEKELLLLGHIDTVPGGPSMQLQEDTLWGRGSVDAKGPLAAFCVAGGMARLPEGWKITLVGAVCEETDSRGAYHRIPLHQPRACIIGEPSGMTGVTLGYRGHLRVLIHGEDGGAHRSGDAGPLTSCVRAVSSILALIED
ncbi:MAG: M20/M25/M40 family metallo-hydrolase, partial [Synergistales bacterium]|nr:M20/M25/M40 family metallo-hydrolase [Synergistales bacterium]